MTQFGHYFATFTFDNKNIDTQVEFRILYLYRLFAHYRNYNAAAPYHRSGFYISRGLTFLKSVKTWLSIQYLIDARIMLALILTHEQETQNINCQSRCRHRPRIWVGDAAAISVLHIPD